MLQRFGNVARVASRQAPRAFNMQRPAIVSVARNAPVASLTFNKIPMLSVVRPFHTSSTRLSPSSSSSNDNKDGSKRPASPFDNVEFDTSKWMELANEGMAKLQTATPHQLFSWTSYSLAGLTPIAMILSPSFLNFPFDFALGLVIPVHMHMGLVGVIEDYVPRAQQSMTKLILAILSVLTGIGLLKINLCGAGVTESVKCLWREPKEQKKLTQ